MAIQIEYQLTRKESFASLRATRRWFFLGLPICGLVILCMVGFLYYLDGHPSAPSMAFGAYAVFCLVFPMIWLRWISYRQRHLIGLPVNMAFDGDGVFMKSPLGESKLLWSMFRTAQLRSDFWFLKISPYQSIAIPQRVFSVDQEEEFRKLLRKMQLIKA